MSDVKLGMRIGESVFCIGYLLFDLIAGILFLKNGSVDVFLLYGVMTLLLGFGDAFHLVPRVVKHIKGDSEKVRWWMDFGLAVTSVTMTVFYVLLFYIWKAMYYDPFAELKMMETSMMDTVTKVAVIQRIILPVSILIWGTAIARIIICLLPQNNWFTGGNKKLSLCRNIIFAVTGGIEVVLFLISGGAFGITMAVCITLSFLFYIPVTLYAKENPKIGMLMIPKTVMYIIMISLGLSLLG